MDQMPLVLVVDDDPDFRVLLKLHIRRYGYRVVEAVDGMEAIARCGQLVPDLVLLDVQMPGMDGFTACARMREHEEMRATPIIMITAHDDEPSVDRAYLAGADEFITKPIHWAVLRNRMRYLLQAKRSEVALQRSYDNARRVMKGAIHAFSLMGEMRDPYTAGHQRRVADLAAAIATEMGYPPERVEAVHIAGLLHDIGKVSIPIETLAKPGAISDLEYQMIQIHPQVGYEILREVAFSLPVAEYVYQHHERLDGSGYPLRLEGAAIHREAMVLTVADVVEAMSSHRPYRAGLGVERALEEIEHFRDQRYDREVVAACTRLFRVRGFSLLEH